MSDSAAAMGPPLDVYPEHIQHVLETYLRDGRDAAEHALEPIAYPPHDVLRGGFPSISRRLAVFQRDGWLCRYCGCQTILPQVMMLLGGLFPDAFPYHSNWKSGQTHPAFLVRSTSLDHVIPVSHGGDWTDLANLATSCWRCNACKGEFTLEQIGWTIQPVPGVATGWDGLTGLYVQLWEATGRLNNHRAWIAALQVSVEKASIGSTIADSTIADN